MDSASRENGRDAGEPWIVAPAHARVICIRSIRVMAVSELGYHDSNLAGIAAGNHRARMTHERVPGITVVDGANPAMLARRAHDLLRVLDGGGQRLLAKHVEAGSQKRLGDLEMQTVGCRDGGEIEAMRARPFSVEHLARDTGELAH
jgi:hypothetical protein